MTAEQLIEKMESLEEEYQNSCGGYPYDDFELQAIKAFDLTIEVLEKQIPKKPVKKNAGYFHEIVLNTCPSCGCEYSMRDEHSYCPDCGQKLDWSNEE